MKSQEQKRRNKIEKLAEALRSFKIVDRFGLSNLISTKDSPTIIDIKKCINKNKEYLPSGISTDYLAKAILVKIQEPPTGISLWQNKYKGLHLNFKKIPAGKKYASVYQDHILELLNAIFEGILSNPKKEQPSENTLGFIDIVFDNTADEGFFSRLKKEHNIPSVAIPIECKNYSDDLKNEEYHQLYSRLKKNCCFGLLICRKISNRKKSLAHCKGKLTEGKYMLVLDDEDICLLFNLRKKGDYSGIDDFWGQKFRDLIL